jgi:hypothetical protein
MLRSTRSAAALVALLLAGAFAAAAASAAATRSDAAATSFCSVSKGVAKQISTLGSSLSSTATSAQRAATLKSQLTDIKRAEPPLRSTVPRSLKPRLTTVLSFVNLVYAKFSAANWSFATLGQQPKTVAALQAASMHADPAMTAVDTYYRKVCKFDV